MISKILPAHYVIELHGEATTSTIPPSFSVESIVLASTEFESDLHAFAAGEALLKALLPNRHKSKVEINPEFLPSAGDAEELDDELDEEVDEVEAAASEVPANLSAPLPPRLMRVELTKKFDQLGDFVQLRKTYTAKDSKAVLRVLINPSAYMQEKVRLLEERHSPDQIHRELSSTTVLQ